MIVLAAVVLVDRDRDQRVGGYVQVAWTGRSSPSPGARRRTCRARRPCCRGRWRASGSRAASCPARSARGAVRRSPRAPARSGPAERALLRLVRRPAHLRRLRRVRRERSSAYRSLPIRRGTPPIPLRSVDLRDHWCQDVILRRLIARWARAVWTVSAAIGGSAPRVARFAAVQLLQSAVFSRAPRYRPSVIAGGGTRPAGRRMRARAGAVLATLLAGRRRHGLRRCRRVRSGRVDRHDHRRGGHPGGTPRAAARRGGAHAVRHGGAPAAPGAAAHPGDQCVGVVVHRVPGGVTGPGAGGRPAGRRGRRLRRHRRAGPLVGGPVVRAGDRDELPAPARPRRQGTAAG